MANERKRTIRERLEAAKRHAVLRVEVDAMGKSVAKLEVKGLKPFQACAYLFGALADLESQMVDEAVDEINAQGVERRAA